MKTIEIVIDARGDARVQTQGFSDGACRDASALLERALGEVTAERLTPEFYQSSQQIDQQQKQHG